MANDLLPLLGVCVGAAMTFLVTEFQRRSQWSREDRSTHMGRTGEMLMQIDELMVMNSAISSSAIFLAHSGTMTQAVGNPEQSRKAMSSLKASVMLYAHEHEQDLEEITRIQGNLIAAYAELLYGHMNPSVSTDKLALANKCNSAGKLVIGGLEKLQKSIAASARSKVSG